MVTVDRLLTYQRSICLQRYHRRPPTDICSPKIRSCSQNLYCALRQNILPKWLLLKDYRHTDALFNGSVAYSRLSHQTWVLTSPSNWVANRSQTIADSDMVTIDNRYRKMLTPYPTALSPIPYRHTTCFAALWRHEKIASLNTPVCTN